MDDWALTGCRSFGDCGCVHSLWHGVCQELVQWEGRIESSSATAVLPKHGTEDAAGLDLSSVAEKTIPAGEYALVSTGLAVELPKESYGRIAGRSGLAVRGIDVGAGVIDRDYRGEVRVLIRNHSNVDYKVFVGDRIAQLIVEKVVNVKVNEVQSLSSTKRGVAGFGSTSIRWVKEPLSLSGR